jgi:hypothetical protein
MGQGFAGSAKAKFRNIKELVSSCPLRPIYKKSKSLSGTTIIHVFELTSEILFL